MGPISKFCCGVGLKGLVTY